MENVHCEVKDNKLIITIDLGHRGAVSSSGKTVRVASTLGNQYVPGALDGFRLGLNAYVPNR